MSDIDAGLAVALLDAYGSLEDPNFSFVEKRYRARPYAKLLDELGGEYTVTETTDLNHDISVTVALSGDAGDLGLRLSLVGPYAALSDSSGRIVEKHEVELSANTKGLARRLDRNGIEVFGAAWLRKTIVFGRGRDGLSLYEVLFSADEAVFV